MFSPSWETRQVSSRGWLLTGVVLLAWMERFVCKQVFAGSRRNLWRSFISHSTVTIGLQTLTQHWEITLITSHISVNGVCLAALSGVMIGKVSRYVTASPLDLGRAQANTRHRLQRSLRVLFCSWFVLANFLIQDIHKHEWSECRKFIWVQKGLGWIPKGKMAMESWRTQRHQC